MRIVGIYVITHLASGRRYIGSSADLRSRFYQHKSLLKHGKHRNPRLQAAWNKYGPDSFEWAVLEHDVDVSVLTDREQHYLDRFKPHVYNVGDAADCPVRGYFRNASPSHRAAMTAANKRRSGWKHTEEAKDAVRQANKGRVRSAEHREAISRAQKGNTRMLGKKLSPETIARIAAANTGKKRSPEAIANLRAGRLRYLARMKEQAA